MRNMNEFLNSVNSLESKRNVLGDDLSATSELRDDVKTFIDLSRSGRMDRGLEQDTRRKIARGLAYGEYNGDYMTFAFIKRERQIGEGECLSQRARDFDADLTTEYGQDELLRRVSKWADKADESNYKPHELGDAFGITNNGSYENEESAMKAWRAEEYAAVEEEMRSQAEGREMDIYCQILEQENIPIDTKPDRLPYYVVKRMATNGIDVDNLQFDNENLSKSNGYDTMNTGSRRSNLPGRIFGDGSNPRRRGFGDYDTSQNGSLVDEYGENQDNGFNFDEYD